MNIGDNLYTEFHKLKSVKEIDCPPMSPWKEENQLLLLCLSEDVTANNLYFISTADKQLFGMFIKQSDSSYYLLDLNNDSILDSKSTTFYLPYHFIKRKTKISSRDTSVLKMFNHFFSASMQSDENLELNPKEVDFLKRFFLDSTLANRHLVYLFTTYQTIITNAAQKHERVPTEICIPIIEALSEECSSIFKTIPPLIRIFKVEALINDKNLTDRARQEVKLSLRVYPDCIPLQVYDYNLEQEGTLKEEKLRALKKYHENHWMVKPL